MDANMQAQLEAFDALPIDKQRGTVIGILETLQGVNQNYHKIYTIVTEKKTISSKILHTIYADLLKLLQDKQQKIKELEYDALANIHMQVLHIQELEAQERKNESPDSLLSTL